MTKRTKTHGISHRSICSGTCKKKKKINIETKSHSGPVGVVCSHPLPPNLVVPLCVTSLLGKGHSLVWQRKSLRLRLFVAAHGQTPNLPALPVWRRCPSCEESSRTGLVGPLSLPTTSTQPLSKQPSSLTEHQLRARSENVRTQRFGPFFRGLPHIGTSLQMCQGLF